MHMAPSPTQPGWRWPQAFQMLPLATPADALAPAALPLHDWLLAVAEQDQAAFQKLYRALAPRALHLAQRILRDLASAEEAVEDCFWQVWRQAGRFDPARGSAEAWVLTLARTRALDLYRSRQRARQGLVSLEALVEQGEATPDIVDEAAPVELLLDAARHHARLHAALAALAPQARQLVALAFLRGLTHEEIAQQTDLPLGTVKSQIRRALAHLQVALQERSDA